MKPHLVIQADVAPFADHLSSVDDDLAQAMDHVAFFLFPADAKAEADAAIAGGATPEAAVEDWPEGLNLDNIDKFSANPIAGLSHAMAQIEEVLDGIAARMVFGVYNKFINEAAAAEPGTDANLWSTVITKMQDWTFMNMLAYATMPGASRTFFTHFHSRTMVHVAKLVETLQANERSWAKTQEVCEKYGISFDAVNANDQAALAALELASVKDMAPEMLARYVFMSMANPEANQDAVTLAKSRLSELQKAAEAKMAEADGTPPAGHVTGSFKPQFAGALEDDSIRA